MKRGSQHIKYIVLFFCMLFLFQNRSIAKSLSVIPKSHTVVSDSIKLFNRLDSLKNLNQLEPWLNLWYVHLSDNPTAHYKEFTIPLKTIWRKPKTTSEKVAWFYLLILVGYYELQQGNILKSTSVYEKAYQFVQDTKAIHNDEILDYLVKPLGNNYTRLGDYERAFYIQKDGLKLAKKLNAPMQEAAMLANMSTTARWNNHLSEALKYTEEGLEKVKENTALQGLLYSTKADILQDKGQINQAEKTIEKAITLFAKKSFEKASNQAYWYAGTWIIAGEIARKKKSYQHAIVYQQKAFTLLQEYFPDAKQREKLKIKVTLGKIYTTEGYYKKALHLYKQALSGLLPGYSGENPWPSDTILYSENTLLDALSGKARTLHLLGKDSIALVGYQKTAVVLQQLRKAIFSREAEKLLQKQSLSTTEEGISLAFQMYRKTGEVRYANIALQMAEQHKARLLLDDLQRDLSFAKLNHKDSLFVQQKRLKQVLAFYTHSYINATLQNDSRDSLRWKQKIDQAAYKLSLVNQEMKNKYPNLGWETTIKIKDLMTHLPEHTTVWEYFTGPTKWYGFSLNKDGIKQFVYLGKSDSLKRMTLNFVDDWFTAGPEAMINHPEKYYKEAGDIYKKVKLDFTDTDKNLLIIPDGELGRLPFEALVTDTIYRANPANWSYLLFEKKTSQSYSLSVWNQLQQEFSKSDNQGGFAGFFIDPDKDSHLAQLSGVEEEEKKIKSHLGGQFFKNKKATSEKFLQAIQKEEVIHVSTHAFLMGEKQIPALQMADKKILLADLYPLNAHPSLIVVSACQTADGLLSPGEGIISLAREFTAIGAGGVVAALWSINDETAAQLTALYYKKLQKSGDKSGALYQTKRDWLSSKEKNSLLKLPYYWAGLVYYGNNVPLDKKLPAAFHFPFWGWVLISVLLILGIGIWIKRGGKKT